MSEPEAPEIVQPSYLTAQEFKALAAASVHYWRLAGDLAELHGGFELHIGEEIWTFIPLEHEDRTFASDSRQSMGVGCSVGRVDQEAGGGKD